MYEPTKTISEACGDEVFGQADAEERKAWDSYAASMLPMCDHDIKSIATMADLLLLERRKRFNAETKEANGWHVHYGITIPSALMSDPTQLVRVRLRSGIINAGMAHNFFWGETEQSTITHWRFANGR